MPPLLRPVIRFSRLNAKALDTARRAVEEDDELRARIAEAVDEARVGRAGWLWLNRPEGWERQLAALVDARAEADADSDLSRRLQQARRELDAALVASGRADDARRAAEEQATRARADLDGERRARRQAEERIADLEERLAAVDVSRADLELDRDRLRAQGAEAKRELTVRADEIAALKDRLAEAEERSGLGGPDAERLSGALDRARQATDAAARALAEATAELDAPPKGNAGTDASDARSTTVRRRRRRTAVRLPPPLVDNTPEAVVHLVRQAGATVLVDGYNVSMAAWPGMSLASQRERLVDALDGLHARYGADTIVVFDGETGGRRPSTGQGRSIRALFTNEGETADDRIVAMVSAIRGSAPVLVATSDRELRDRVRAAGANVVAARPFLAVLLR